MGTGTSKGVPVQAKKALMKQVVSLMLQPFNPSKKAPGTHRAGLDALEKRKFLVSAENQTTIPQSPGLYKALHKVQVVLKNEGS
jgi:hypothetical protein